MGKITHNCRVLGVREVNVTISRAHKHNSLERCNNMNYAEKLNFRQSVDLNIRRGVVWYARDSRIRSLRDCNDHYIAHRYYSVRLRCLLETPSRLSVCLKFHLQVNRHEWNNSKFGIWTEDICDRRPF